MRWPFWLAADATGLHSSAHRESGQAKADLQNLDVAVSA